eukprot:253996_1
MGPVTSPSNTYYGNHMNSNTTNNCNFTESSRINSNENDDEIKSNSHSVQAINSNISGSSNISTSPSTGQSYNNNNYSLVDQVVSISPSLTTSPNNNSNSNNDSTLLINLQPIPTPSITSTNNDSNSDNTQRMFNQTSSVTSQNNNSNFNNNSTLLNQLPSLNTSPNNNPNDIPQRLNRLQSLSIASNTLPNNNSNGMRQRFNRLQARAAVLNRSPNNNSNNIHRRFTRSQGRRAVSITTTNNNLDNNSNNNDNNSIQLLLGPTQSHIAASQSNNTSNNNNSNSNHTRSNNIYGLQSPPTQTVTQTNNSSTPQTTTVKPYSIEEKDKLFGRWNEYKRKHVLKTCADYHIQQYGENYRYPHYKLLVARLVVQNKDLYQYLTPQKMRKEFERNVTLVAKKIADNNIGVLKLKSQKDLVPYVKKLDLSCHMVRMKDGQTLKDYQKEIEENRNRCDKENLDVHLNFVNAKKKKEAQVKKQASIKNSYYESGIERNKQWAANATIKAVNEIEHSKGIAITTLRQHWPTGLQTVCTKTEAITEIRRIDNEQHVLFRSMCGFVQEIKAAEDKKNNNVMEQEQKDEKDNNVMGDIIEDNIKYMWSLKNDSNNSGNNSNNNSNNNITNAIGDTSITIRSQLQLSNNSNDTSNENGNDCDVMESNMMDISVEDNTHTNTLQNNSQRGGNVNNVGAMIEVNTENSSSNGNDVKQWLNSFGMGRYYDVLIQNDFDSLAMVELIDDKPELEKLGIFGAHKLLLWSRIKR